LQTSLSTTYFSQIQPFNMGELLTFQKFNDMTVANELADKLEKGGVTCAIKDESKFFDVSFAYNSVDPEIALKVDADDFEKANTILDEYYSSQADTIEKDYYLFSFTDEELMEILSKPDEWGRFDYQLAKKILAERGRAVQPGTAEMLKERRINELAVPERISSTYIAGGYIASLLLPFAGLIMALVLVTAKKTLPDGQRMYTYSEADRKHGRIMLALSIVLCSIGVVFKFWQLLPRMNY
jgi:hypothetical protein